MGSYSKIEFKVNNHRTMVVVKLIPTVGSYFARRGAKLIKENLIRGFHSTAGNYFARRDATLSE